MAISGNYAIVGAYLEDDAGGTSSGKAYIYDLTSTSSFSVITSTSTTTTFEFGRADNVDGTFIIDLASLGLSLSSTITINSIDIRGDLSSPSTEYIDLKLSTSASYDRYTSTADDATYRNKTWIGGQPVSSGNVNIDYIIPSSVNFSPSGMPSGYYWQVRFNITVIVPVTVAVPTLNLLYTLNNPNAYSTSDTDRFGFSVAISGNYAIVGARNEDDAGGVDSGKAYIFSEPFNTKTVTLTGNIGQTGDTYITGLFDNNNISVTGVGSYLQVPNINILDNVISTTTSNLDLTFTANGTGGVVFANKLKIVDNVISNVWVGASNNTKKSILFTPDGTGSLVINTTSALTVPYSNNATRVLSVNGEIRQNSLDGEYEGFNNTGNESLTQFHSADKKTFITPELALGTNDNIIRMYVNNTLKATIDVDKMASNVLQVGNFVLSGNTINNPVTGSDTIIQPSGTGSIDANGLLFKDSSITNTLSTPIVLASTGIGYIKFTGTGAVVFPYGNTSDRRLTPELGETRYNYQLNYMEVFNGTSWIPATGTSGAAPLNEVLDIMDLWSLVLG